MAAVTRSIPTVKLNSGVEMPTFGLGTWKSKPGEVGEAVKNAIEAGYRHIDGAMVYQNEPEIGNTLKAVFDAGIVKREELFYTSKLWNTFHSRDQVVPALKKTLQDLQLDYLDMYLIHWPVGFEEGGGLFPVDDKGQAIVTDVDYMETWKGMEEALQLGLTKNIGVSNFNSEMILRILKEGSVPPATNQFEVHPYLANKKLVDLCQSNGIAVTGYSPLGSPDRPWAKPDDPKLLDDPKLIELGKKYNKSAAQVVLRWSVQRNIITIPKSVNRKRLEENINIFDFTLTDEDMEYVFSFDRNGRNCPMDNATHSKYWPFHIEY